jgi:Oxidoreductase family, NAD-binding Rossmann fold
MGHLVRSIGMLGVSEGNGHPFSYSVILNGYSAAGLAASGWPGIYRYVRRRHASEFGIAGWQVTHAWTQDPAVTEKLCAAALIPHCVAECGEMLGAVDAVMIARDDHEVHLSLARPFLEAGVPVFIDKPLSVDLEALRFFLPYLQSGQLMSCSGMRYARELDDARADLAQFGQMRLMRGAIVLSWEKYGVHLLEALLSLTEARPVSIAMHAVAHASASIRLDDGVLIELDALGDVPATFRVELFGSKRIEAFDINDNFSMFRRMLWEFANGIASGRPAIAPERTLEIMRVLIAGRISRQEGREVYLHEVTL